MSAPATGRRARPAVDASDGVLARAAAVLGAFRSAPEPALTLTAIAARSGLPLTTAHRLCAQLVREGMLERDGRSYRVGLHLWEIGTLAPRAHGLREIALPYLEDLHAVTGQHVQLVVVDGHESVVLERLSARDATPLDGRSGGRLPIHATSGGVAILACGHDELLDRVAHGPLVALSAETITTERGLRAAVAGVRTRGYAELRGAITPSLTSVAAPVLLRGGRAVAAVSVITSDPSTRELLPALMTTALGVARNLQR